MNNIVLYNHGGSGNHGCEALVRTASALLGRESKVKLLSDSPEQDEKYHIDEIAEIQSSIAPVSRLSAGYLKAYLKLKRSGDYFDMDALPYLKSLSEIVPNSIAISIGGDNYCYEFYPKFIRMHQCLVERGVKTVLLGCSLEENLFKDEEFVDDMQSYSLITARESLTYRYLKENGIKNVKLIPDSAFTLPKELPPLPNGFIEGNTVGINVSPLVEKRETKKGLVYESFKTLIDEILSTSDSSVALIPHVVGGGNDDRSILNKLYKVFENSDRVVLIEDCNCMQLKGYILRCRFFIGARTHATIAAYSTGVPTLVLGYSVKSRGIAKDIFGTDKGYVLPIEKLYSAEDLLESYHHLKENEAGIKNHLNSFMPSYIEKAKQISDLENFLDEKFTS